MSPRSFSCGEHGSIAILFSMVLLPLLVGISFGALRLSQLNDLRLLRETCRETSITAQQKAGTSIQTLLRLNPLVAALKIEKAAAQAALVTAAATYNLPGVRAAQQWLAAVHKRQVALRSQQVALVRMGDVDLTSARLAMISSAERWLGSERLLYKIRLERPAFSPARLAVRPVRKEEFPVYELETPFSRRQALELKWLVHFEGKQKGVKKWINFDFALPESCGATLVENQGAFDVRLSQARYFWSR